MTSTARLGTTSSTRYGKCDDGDYRETSDYRREHIHPQEPHRAPFTFRLICIYLEG